MTNSSSDVARRRRLAEVWRASAPSRDEIVHLRARIERSSRRPRASRGKVIIVALVQGLFFGAATLAAAAWIAGEASPGSPRTAVAPAPAPAKVERSGSSTPMVAEPGLTAGTPTAAFGDVADEARNPGAADGPRSSGDGEQKPSAARAPSGIRPPLPAVSEAPSVAAVEAPPIGAAPMTDGPWARVAQALSEKDWSGADRALNDLSSSSDPTTRDAADLARAELSIARGDAGSLRPLVERLARSGATGLIRKRAAALLSRLPSR